MGREKYRVDENNVLMMPFGQLLAHDLTGMAVDILISPQGKVIFLMAYCVITNNNIIVLTIELVHSKFLMLGFY